jgi:hypothetical protein
MISYGNYDPYSGQPVSAGTTQRSYGVYDVEPRRGAIPPSDQPQPDAHAPGAFDGTAAGRWRPSDAPTDPHDADYDVDGGGDDVDGDFNDGPTTADVPDNIVT